MIGLAAQQPRNTRRRPSPHPLNCVPAGRRYVTLGTDGFGRSDSRAQLREYFEVSPRHIVLRALQALADDSALDAAVPAAARQRYGIGSSMGPHPWTV